MPLIVKCSNGIVTDTYLEMIGEAISSKYEDVRYTNDLKNSYKEPRTELIVVARTVDAFKLLIIGYKNVMVWFQGVEPEESFMAHHSKLRYWVLSFMERYILQRSVFCFFVSEAMKQHYETKYSIRFSETKNYCMPCLNTQIHKDSFFAKDKYAKNTFAYIGSLAVWQKFEETVKTFKMIESSGVKDCSLRVYTSEKDEAKQILDKYGVNNYLIDFVRNDELPERLKDVKYGFIIREDTAVNRVATPTKISTYLSCGIIPIYSECLDDFAKQAKKMVYAVNADTDIIKQIKEFDKNLIEGEKIFAEYSILFDTHYNRDEHIKKITAKLGE